MGKTGRANKNLARSLNENGTK